MRYIIFQCLHYCKIFVNDTFELKVVSKYLFVFSSHLKYHQLINFFFGYLNSSILNIFVGIFVKYKIILIYANEGYNCYILHFTFKYNFFHLVLNFDHLILVLNSIGTYTILRMINFVFVIF